ncbi:peptidyl-prolyl cis-trans isomerase [candidate division WOR-3 bacterium]|nr:peptidyl-prolyl cis-trans isomerase [candidate division WOR-3 bacterium]
MQKLRKYIKYVLLIALISFAALIFFNWGADIQGQRRDNTTDIAVINGEEISYRQYMSYKQEKLQSIRGITDEEIWNLMIEEFIWQHLIIKERLGVTDEELWAIIRSNPPREVMEADFMKNEQGEFDYEKYLELLRSPQSRSWLYEYEMSLRRQVPREKLRSLLTTFGWVAPFEDSLYVARQTTFFDFRILSIPIFAVRGRVLVSEADARAYYEEHREEYKNPEQKILKYVFFVREASPDDSLEARERLEDFTNRIEDGEDFLVVAQEVSDDTAIVHEFEPGNPVAFKPYLMNVYTTLKDGEMSDIIQASHGYEIIKRVHKGLVYKVRADIRVSSTTKADINDRMEAFMQAAGEIGFDSAAMDLDIAVRQTYPMTTDNVTFPVRDREGLAEYLKRAKKDKVEGPFSSIGGYYLFTLDSVIPSSIPVFEAIQPRIEAELERDMLAEFVEKKLTTLYDQLVSTMPVQEVLAHDSMVVYQDQDNVQLTWVQNALGSEVAGRVARMEPGEISAPLVTEWAGYIVMCNGKRTIPIDSSMVFALQMKRQSRIEQIMRDVFTPDEMKDNRDIFFE